MTSMNKRRKAHVISALCIIAAVILCVVLFRSPVFNPGRAYTNNALLFEEQERYHNTRSTVSPVNDGTQTFSIERFSGVRTIRVMDATDGTHLSYAWDITVNSGKFKIVLIDMDKVKLAEIICEGSGSGTVDDYLMTSGDYRIKFVGDGANVEGTLTAIQSA